MKTLYHSLFFIFYKIIQYGKAGKLWAASSSSYVIPVVSIITLHLTIGLIFGRAVVSKNYVIPLGITIMVFWTVFNLVYFLRKKKYLEIEADFLSKPRKRKMANFVFLVFLLWILGVFYIAFN